MDESYSCNCEQVAKDGLIKYSEKSYDNLKFFDVNEVISQLRKQKQ